MPNLSYLDKWYLVNRGTHSHTLPQLVFKCILTTDRKINGSGECSITKKVAAVSVVQSIVSCAACC